MGEYRITRNRLYIDLLVAESRARQHKSSKEYVARYEKHLRRNLIALCDELFERRYKAQPSTCFCVDHPKKREIFAAEFKDRIVHHLIFNYVHVMLERTFIHDSYSCIKDRGTHFGIERMAKHIRSCSQNYRRKVYVMKMDIKGYFMHIDRALLYKLTADTILKMADRESDIKGVRWRERIDIDFVLYMIREVIMLDPTEDCRVVGTMKDWEGLPNSKSLFYSPAGCGLPIGNLTSQLFSNVYLNGLDQYMKRSLGCKYYGRYVDDFYVVSESCTFLHNVAKKAEEYLKRELRLGVNRGKTKIYLSTQGVDFLGGYIKPGRVYISAQSLRRMKRQMRKLGELEDEDALASINSYLGVLSHFKTYNIRRSLIATGVIPPFARYASIDKGCTKLTMHKWRLRGEQKERLEKVAEMVTEYSPSGPTASSWLR